MLRHLFILIPLFAFATCPVKPLHNSNYKLGWDIDFSPYAGGEDLLFATRFLERLEGYILGKTPACYADSAPGRFWRATELYLGWLPINYLATVAQHEVFGHGYRIRDINRGKAKVKGYSFNSPPPYGNGGAKTTYLITSDLTTTEESSISMAGFESTAILALLTKFKWLESNWIDPRQTVLYLLSQYNLNLYIGSLDISNEDTEGHDIEMYVKTVNYTYTNSFLKSSSPSLSYGSIRTLALSANPPFSQSSISEAASESKRPLARISQRTLLPMRSWIDRMSSGARPLTG